MAAVGLEDALMIGCLLSHASMGVVSSSLFEFMVALLLCRSLRCEGSSAISAFLAGSLRGSAQSCAPGTPTDHFKFKPGLRAARCAGLCAVRSFARWSALTSSSFCSVLMSVSVSSVKAQLYQLLLCRSHVLSCQRLLPTLASL